MEFARFGAGVGLVLYLAGPLAARAASQSATQLLRPTARAVRITESIVVDGELSEAVWQQPAAYEIAYEVRPGENTPAPMRTEGWVAYDERAIYFAFRAHDPEPGKIRARFADRDSVFHDDFLGVELDTFSDQRRAFEFFVNPLGVQSDLILDDVTGGEDESWDAIWESAGKITASGYQVEMAIPFRALRFPAGGGAQTWGFDAIRVMPRERSVQTAFAPRDRGRNCFLCGIGRLEGLDGLHPGRALELTPTLTGMRADERPDLRQGSWIGGKEETELGLTARWGMTPNITALAALNPDFSQVEADAAQLDVNTRFALFYPEKRPFFLDGADGFDSVLDVVYTRDIADPEWGVKLAGKQGGNAFGLIVARDSRTNLLFPGAEGSDLGSLEAANTSTVVRYRRDLPGNSTLGAFYTGREGAGYHSRLLGLDSLFRPGERHRIRLEAFASRTAYPDAIRRDFAQPEGELGGHALRLAYGYLSREWNGSASFQELSPDFRADLGFIPRVGYRVAAASLQRIFHGDGERWFDQIRLGGDADETRTSEGDLLEREASIWVMYHGPWGSSFELQSEARREVYRGVTFDQLEWSMHGEVQPRSWLGVELSVELGDAIDFAGVRAAERFAISPEVTLLLGRQLKLQLEHDFERLEVDAGWLFDAAVTELRASWQFNLRTQLRWVSQHFALDRDPALFAEAISAEEREWFNQLLFSYKLNPQTVLYLGYSDTALGDEQIHLTRANRTYFAKLGYAWQL